TKKVKGKNKKVKTRKYVGALNSKEKKEVKKRLNNGALSSKTSISDLIKFYGEDKAKTVQDYISYMEKARDAKKNKESAIKSRREAKIQQYQNYVELYDEKRNPRRAAQRENMTTYSPATASIKETIKDLEKSYNYQILIAKETNDTEKVLELTAKKQKEINDLKLEAIDAAKKEYEYQLILAKTGGTSRNTGLTDIQNQLSLLEARGSRVSSNFYTSQNSINGILLKNAETERSRILSELSTITKGSPQYYKALEELQAVEDTINSTKTEIVENNNKIVELRDAINEDIKSRNNSIKDEIQTLADITFGEEVDSSNNLTDKYMATLGAAAVSYETAIANFINDNDTYKPLRDAVAKGKSGNNTVKDKAGNDVYIIGGVSYESWEKVLEEEQKYASYVQSDLKEEKSAINSIIDLVKKAYEAQLNKLKEIIDAKKKIMQENKALYDYEKSIEDKTKNVAKLQKQMAALQGDTSEEGRAKLQKLQVSLDEAQSDLQETEWDHALSVQQDMLDNLASEYEELMNKLFDDQDKLLKRG
ncbi:MAG: hypothetical protein Q4E61_04565, partial [Alphaproteobacteria bacterium]|nr:hypothetical protein [Alphaproteobacteria bacterium]